MKALLAWIANARDWLTLIVVASIGAWMYVEFATVKRDRDALAHWADVACAAGGTAFAGEQVQRVDRSTGKPVTVTYGRGQLCRARIVQLAAFKADTDATTAATLAQAMRDHDDKSNKDAGLARTAAEAARAAAERMEIADAEAERSSRVDRDWFAALNDVAGLRPADR